MGAGIQVPHVVGDQNLTMADLTTRFPCELPAARVRRSDGSRVRGSRSCAVSFRCDDLRRASAVGLPAVYVPLPIGNGEQRLNAAGIVSADGGRSAGRPTFPDSVADMPPLLPDPQRLGRMVQAAAGQGVRDAGVRLADLIEQAAAMGKGGK